MTNLGISFGNQQVTNRWSGISRQSEVKVALIRDKFNLFNYNYFILVTLADTVAKPRFGLYMVETLQQCDIHTIVPAGSSISF